MAPEAGLEKERILSVHVVNNLTQKTGVKSEKLQRASETNNMASASFIAKDPSIVWSMDQNLYSRFRMWKQRCELLSPGRWLKFTRKSNVILVWRAGYRAVQQLGSVCRRGKSAGQLLGKIWALRETTLKWVHKPLIATESNYKIDRTPRETSTTASRHMNFDN